MALNPSVHFVDIGSYIGVFNSLSGNLTEFQTDVVAAVEILDADWTRIQLLPTFISNMNAASSNIQQGMINIDSSFGTYHTSVLASELPSSQSTVSGVITDLFAAMTAYGPPQTFKENGYFHSYYRDRFSRTDVPTAPDPTHTVNDSWAE